MTLTSCKAIDLFVVDRDVKSMAPCKVLIAFLIGSMAAPLAAVDFEKQILPIFESKCLQCHRAPYEDKGRMRKPKGGLVMDAAKSLLAGGDSGDVIVNGEPDQSELFIRVTLPQDDSDFMPPEGKADPLTAEELAIFREWIATGADFGGWVGNVDGSAPVMLTEESSISSDIDALYTRLGEGIELPASPLIEKVTQVGGMVSPLSRQSPLLSINFRFAGEEATNEDIATVGSIGNNVAQLDLSKTKVDDAALTVLSKTPKLVRLNMSQTQIGDEGLKHLSNLNELRYLNLYASAVSDKGLQYLAGLKSLEAIYLWISKVTPEGVEKLRASLPNTDINFE